MPTRRPGYVTKTLDLHVELVRKIEERYEGPVKNLGRDILFKALIAGCMDRLDDLDLNAGFSSPLVRADHRDRGKMKVVHIHLPRHTAREIERRFADNVRLSTALKIILAAYAESDIKIEVDRAIRSRWNVANDADLQEVEVAQ
jgi:hypothetical protein